MVLELITLTKSYCFISIFRSYFIFSPTYLFLCFHFTYHREYARPARLASEPPDLLLLPQGL